MLRKIVKRLATAQQITDLTKERFREINELNRTLAIFNIRFSDLVELTQNNINDRQFFEIGKRLADDPNLINDLISTKSLSIQQLSERVDVSAATINDYLSYIITIALIHYGPYPFLRQYFDLESCLNR